MARPPRSGDRRVIATDPRQRLWERRHGDADRLLLRVGTGTLPSGITVTDPDKDNHQRAEAWTLPDVPVAVPLAEHGVLGVGGRGDEPRALGRWLLAQAAILHSPADLQVCVLTNAAGRVSWDWVRWLPHARPRVGQPAFTL